MEEVKLSIDLYNDGSAFCAYLSDNCGGSGIKVEGATPEACANNLALYIADYFYGNEEEE